MKQKLKVKYFLDYIFSIVLFCLMLPLLIVIGISIYMDSKGDIIFKQKRLGQYGRVFNIYKFRTMIENAENIGDGLVIKSNNDLRVTRVGRFLRGTSLDELPQIINIIKGEMSFIGPRPPVTYHPYNGYENYSSFAKKRFSVKPGITGLAQIRLRNSASWDERIKVDIEYVDNYSLFLDLKILFFTLFSLINKEEYTE